MQAKQFWTKAYQRNIARMVGMCCRYVGDRAVAEDLAHEAFLKAIEKSGTYRRLGSFDGWLMRINLNTTMDYLRRQPTFLSMDDDTMGTQFIASASDVVETCHGASLQDEPDETCISNPTSPNPKSSMPSAPCPTSNGPFSTCMFLKTNLMRKSRSHCKSGCAVPNAPSRRRGPSCKSP